MACSRGCCATQAEHYKSLTVARPEVVKAGKTRVDEHDTHRVVVHESGDRQDVTVKVPSVQVSTTQTELR